MFDICLVTDAGRWDDQWSYVLSHWKPRNMYFIGDFNGDIKPFRVGIQIATAEELPTNIPIVAMQPETARYVMPTIPLSDFVHPDECIYLFGNDHTHLCEDQLGGRVPDVVVSIPTDTHDAMYSWTAGAVTLYDRTIRHG